MAELINDTLEYDEDNDSTCIFQDEDEDEVKTPAKKKDLANKSRIN